MFYSFFFHFGGFPAELFYSELFGSISNIKILQLWACVLPPCETSQLKPAGLWGGLSCLLLPDNFTSCNYLTHSFFSSKVKWIFFFLFTGCYPTRAFWGHVHSSWCNLSPSEYPGKLHCVFHCILFPAHLLSTFTVCVHSHSSGEDFKAVFRLVNWICSPCFTTTCKNTFDFYSSALVLSVT